MLFPHVQTLKYLQWHFNICASAEGSKALKLVTYLAGCCQLANFLSTSPFLLYYRVVKYLKTTTMYEYTYVDSPFINTYLLLYYQALAPVSAIEDRICIYKNGTATELSAHEPISCCKTCGWGCLKGYPQMVYKQYITKGLVTGGEYGSKKVSLIFIIFN